MNIHERNCSRRFDKEASCGMAHEGLYILRYGFGPTFWKPQSARDRPAVTRCGTGRNSMGKPVWHLYRRSVISKPRLAPKFDDISYLNIRNKRMLKKVKYVTCRDVKLGGPHPNGCVQLGHLTLIPKNTHTHLIPIPKNTHTQVSPYPLEITQDHPLLFFLTISSILFIINYCKLNLQTYILIENKNYRKFV